EWEEGCSSCSFWADSFNGNGVHLNHRDTTFVAISRAPLAKIEPFKQRMGWSFKWLSSGASDFNFDYQASFTPEQVKSGAAFYNYTVTDPGDLDREGISVFSKDESGAVLFIFRVGCLQSMMRNIRREHNEFATRTSSFSGAAADPGRCVVGHSDLAV